MPGRVQRRGRLAGAGRGRRLPGGPGRAPGRRRRRRPRAAGRQPGPPRNGPPPSSAVSGWTRCWSAAWRSAGRARRRARAARYAALEEAAADGRCLRRPARAHARRPGRTGASSGSPGAPASARCPACRRPAACSCAPSSPCAARTRRRSAPHEGLASGPTPPTPGATPCATACRAGRAAGRGGGPGTRDRGGPRAHRRPVARRRGLPGPGRGVGAGRAVRADRPGELRLDLPGLRALDPALAGRALRAAVVRAGGEPSTFERSAARPASSPGRRRRPAPARGARGGAPRPRRRRAGPLLVLRRVGTGPPDRLRRGPRFPGSGRAVARDNPVAPPLTPERRHHRSQEPFVDSNDVTGRPPARPLQQGRDQDTRIAELAAPWTPDYRGRDVLLVGVLKGAVMVMADLCRALQRPRAPWTGWPCPPTAPGRKSSGVVRILKDLDTDLTGETCSSSRTSSTRA